MKDKEIVLNTLNHIKHQNGHTDIKPYWTELNIDEESQVRIKVKLEDNNLATPHIYDAWKLMITTSGLKITPKDLKEDGNLKKRVRDKEYIKGIKTTLLGVFIGFILSAGLEFIKAAWLSDPPILLPKIQIVHDTIYKFVPADNDKNK